MASFCHMVNVASAMNNMNSDIGLSRQAISEMINTRLSHLIEIERRASELGLTEDKLETIRSQQQQLQQIRSNFFTQQNGNQNQNHSLQQNQQHQVNGFTKFFFVFVFLLFVSFFFCFCFFLLFLCMVLKITHTKY